MMCQYPANSLRLSIMGMYAHPPKKESIVRPFSGVMVPVAGTPLIWIDMINMGLFYPGLIEVGIDSLDR